MKLSDKIKSKNTLKTEEFEYQGEMVKIQELTGRQKLKVQELVEDTFGMAEYMWNTCVLSESLKMNHKEFVNAFDYCFEEVDFIVAKIVKLSAITVESVEELEKN